MPIKTEKLLISLLMIMTVLPAGTKSPKQSHEDTDMLGLPIYYYDIGTFPMVSRDSVKVVIKTKVPFDALQFIKQGDIFTANYELFILIVDENDKKHASKIWKQNLQTESYYETNSQQLFDINEVIFRLLPGKYKLTLSILDLDTKKKYIRRDEINIADFYDKPLTISTIDIIEQVLTDEQGKPDDISSIDGDINDRQTDFVVRFDILSNGGIADIGYRILSQDEKIVTKETFTDTLDNGITNQRLTISRKSLGYSKYKIVIEVAIGKDKVSRSRVFNLRWIGMSKLIDDLDAAIEQMKYIVHSKKFKKLKKASAKEKKNEFIKFWENMDPTPETEENELMNEYYRRVRYANAHFSGFTEGWKTDMGMIFILFGPPNDIERHPFELHSKPYEIWYYYDINKTFIFVDETGFGDYRLTEPYYENIFRY